MTNPFRYFKTSPEIIRLAVMMYVRFPLSLRNVEDLLHERGIDITYETVRFWWNRFDPMFAREIRKRRIHNQNYSNWAWHLNECCQTAVPTSAPIPAVSAMASAPQKVTRSIARQIGAPPA